jgi:hypothetical protein
MLEILAIIINKLLDSKIIKAFLLVLTGIFAGYTLQRVPTWLNKLFYESNIFKFIIIFLILSISDHLSDHLIEGKDIIYITGLSIFILVLFHIFRTFDK